MASMWDGATDAGLEFTFKMLLIGVSLAIGVFTALLPSKKWMIHFYNRHIIPLATITVTKYRINNVMETVASDIHMSTFNPISKHHV
jgi:hypothetical protein